MDQWNQVKLRTKILMTCVLLCVIVAGAIYFLLGTPVGPEEHLHKNLNIYIKKYWSLSNFNIFLGMQVELSQVSILTSRILVCYTFTN
jgi:hypothetical protein